MSDPDDLAGTNIGRAAGPDEAMITKRLRADRANLEAQHAALSSEYVAAQNLLLNADRSDGARVRELEDLVATCLRSLSAVSARLQGFGVGLGSASAQVAKGTRRSIYIKREDVPVWDRFQELAGDSVSQLLSDQVRRYVAERDGGANGFGRIVVEAQVSGIGVPDGPWANELRKIAFYGRWLVGQPVIAKSGEGFDVVAVSDGDMHFYGIALTRRLKIAVLILDKAWGADVVSGGSKVLMGAAPKLRLYDSLKEAAADESARIPQWILQLAADELSTDELADELDI